MGRVDRPTAVSTGRMICSDDALMVLRVLPGYRAQRLIVIPQQGNAVRCGEEIPLVAGAPDGMTFKRCAPDDGDVCALRISG